MYPLSKEDLQSHSGSTGKSSITVEEKLPQSPATDEGKLACFWGDCKQTMFSDQVCPIFIECRVPFPGINSRIALEKIPDLKWQTQNFVLGMRCDDALQHLIEELNPGRLPEDQYKLLISFFGRVLDTDAPIDTLKMVTQKLESLPICPMLIDSLQSRPGVPGIEEAPRPKSGKRTWNESLGSWLDCEFSPRKQPCQSNVQRSSTTTSLGYSIEGIGDDVKEAHTNISDLLKALLNGYKKKISKNETRLYKSDSCFSVERILT